MSGPATAVPISWTPGEPLVRLEVQGFGPAVVALPRQAVTPSPVVVALHGHAVRPEHACENWSRASNGSAFVLCPHGLPSNAPPDAPVTFGSPAATRREIDADMQALRARFGSLVSDGPMVLAGYSMGARLAVALAHADPGTFPIAVLGEGGYDLLTDRTAADFASHHVRVLLLCSTRLCEPTFAIARDRLARAGVAVRLASSGGSRHMFEGAVVEVAQQQWPWLVADDDRWRQGDETALDGGLYAAPPGPM